MNNLKEILKEILKVKNILILSHYNPDGDAVGSMMALKLMIEKYNINVDTVISNHMEFIDKLPDEIKLKPNGEYDLTIIVDANDKKRLGELEYLYDNANKIIILDHHKLEEELDVINYVDSSASSATMVIYDFAKENNIELDKRIAYYLYLGLLTDTGGFVFNNTNSRSFLMASDLLSYGINHSELYSNFINMEYDINYLKLKQIAISNLEIIDDKIAVTLLKNEDITKNKFDTPKILVDLGRNLKNIEVSIIFIEKEPNYYKVSLRSKKYLDVSKISKVFNGGGHHFASGIEFIGNYEKTKTKILNEIIKELN